MKLGLSTAAFYGRMETEDAAAHVQNFPVQCCEVFLQTYSEYSYAFGESVRARLGDMCCTSVHAKGSQFELELFGRSSRQAEDAMRFFAGACDAAQALGAKYYVFHGPGSAVNPAALGRIYALQERFARLREIAAQRGVEILWENVSWCALRTPGDVLQAKELLPGLGFVLDVKQAWRTGADLQQMTQAMGRDLKHVHVLDRDAGGCLCLPGQGVTDWPLLLGLIRQMNNECAVILEPYESQARDEQALQSSLEYLHGLIFSG